MSNPDFPRPRWDTSAYRLKPLVAARDQIAAGQAAQHYAARLMMRCEPGSDEWVGASRVQAEAYGLIVRGRARLAELEHNPPCAKCEGRGFYFPTTDRECLPLWCDACAAGLARVAA